MKNIKLTRTQNTVSAPYLPYAAYNAFVKGATELNAKIERSAKGTTVATFDSVKTAEKFKNKWTAEYNANKKPSHAPEAYDPAREYEDLMDEYDAQKTSSSKPTATKGKKAPRKSKGNSVDFNAFKGTKSEKNKALHAMLVSKGIKDSRTAEYQAVWNARPWAK